MEELEELELLKSRLSENTIDVLEEYGESESLLNDLKEMISLWKNIGGDLDFYEVCDLIEYLDFKIDLENN